MRKKTKIQYEKPKLIVLSGDVDLTSGVVNCAFPGGTATGTCGMPGGSASGNCSFPGQGATGLCTFGNSFTGS